MLYATGTELEEIFKKAVKYLGATVSPSKYDQEEYVLEYNGDEYLVEVKGVAKSISLKHVRQLAGYMFKFEEDTGKKCKGILFGNSWREKPLENRGQENTVEFPNNVIERATELGISLVSSKAFFETFIEALDNSDLSEPLLKKITGGTGIALASKN